MNDLSRRVLLLLCGVLLSTLTGWAGERVVDLTAADGAKFKATYFDSGKPGPGVLLLHQCNRDRKVWDGLARQLAAAGIHVLTFDLRGFGESAGERYADLLPDRTPRVTKDWPSDLDVVFQYLVSQPGVQREWIGAGGASCGVGNSIQLARRHPEVRSLVLLSGGTDAGGRQFLRGAKQLPVLLAFADDDEFPASIVQIQWLYSLAADPEKRILRYAKGGHGADIFPSQPELPSEIVDWYVTTLLKTPGHAPVPKEAPAIPREVRVLDTLEQPGGVANVRQQLEEARRRDPKAQLFPEGPLNVMGYEHLQAGDIKKAIEILELNAVAFPQSPNVYDSLGDIYLANGQKDLAKQNAEKALQLLATDTTDSEQQRKAIRESAEAKLKQLGAAVK